MRVLQIIAIVGKSCRKKAATATAALVNNKCIPMALRWIHNIGGDQWTVQRGLKSAPDVAGEPGRHLRTPGDLGNLSPAAARLAPLLVVVPHTCY